MLRKYLSNDGKVRISSAVTTDLATAVLPKMEVSPGAVIIQSRAVTAALLMASQQKEHYRTRLALRGDGPIGWVTAEAYYDGRVRSCCANPVAAMPGSRPGTLLGAGVLEVAVEGTQGQQTPQMSVVGLVNGEVGDDVAAFYQQSRQIPSVVSLTAMADENGCAYAGGYIVELMPGHDEDTIRRAEQLQAQTPPLSQLLQKPDCDPFQLVESFVEDFGCDSIDYPGEPRAWCDCSFERMASNLRTIGKDEISSMLEENRIFGITCNLCSSVYQFGPVQLQKVLTGS